MKYKDDCQILTFHTWKVQSQHFSGRCHKFLLYSRSHRVILIEEVVNNITRCEQEDFLNSWRLLCEEKLRVVVAYKWISGQEWVVLFFLKPNTFEKGPLVRSDEKYWLSKVFIQTKFFYLHWTWKSTLFYLFFKSLL